MFDRTDVLWREEPTPAPADKAARGNDLARQGNDRPGAPGQRPHDAADDRRTDGPPREPPEDQRIARQYRDDPARTQLATERHDRERERLDRISEARTRPDAAADEPRRTTAPADRPPREVWPENTEGHTMNHPPLGPDGQAAFERAQERARRDPPARATVPEEHRPDRQAREDGRTWTAGRTWTDQARAGSQRFTKDTPRRTDGHRREHDAREAQPRDRRTRTTRDRDAIADVGMYHAVAYKDLSEQHYDNHPYVTRRAVNRMVRDGLLEEHEATGPQGHTFTVLTATARGRDAAHRAALDAGHVPAQQTWTGLVKPAELSHDTAVYRAALDERARIEADGGRVVRVRLDAELKSLVATATEQARAEGGDRAAEDAKRAAAQALGLPMQDGHVMYPDAQLDIEDSQGMGGRVNVEIASDHYHAAAIVAKAGAGFALHGSSRSANQNISRALGRAAARETDSGPGGGSGPGRDGSVEL